MKTGNSAPVDRALLAEIAIWLGYHLLVRAHGMVRRMTSRRRRAIWFAPDIPAGRYMVRSAALWAGIRVARSPQAADAAFYFDDSSCAVPPPPGNPRHFNFRCGDIRKSRIGAEFAEAAGYPLTVDPVTWHGEAVEKSERNGAHDGRIVRCPCPPRPGKTYQRLIDTVGEDGCTVDLRTHCVGGAPRIVWIKRRHPERRFLAANLSAVRCEPAAVFSASEIELIVRFLDRIGGDWCALDILRDRDGRIYVVDVNKTDAGPIIALPLAEKLASTAILAAALEEMIDAGASLRR